jgi:ribosome recycling factor
LRDIERAIFTSDLRLTRHDGKLIRSHPTAQRRTPPGAGQVVRRRVEEGKVTIRNCRRDALEELREFEKEKLIPEDEFYRTRDELQELTDRYIEEIDKVQERKEQEIKEI